MIAERTKMRPAPGQPASRYTASAVGAATYSPPAALPARPLSEPRVRERRAPVKRRGGLRGARSPMTVAVLVGTFLVSLLCCYVYAYARVTAAGFELSSVRRDFYRAKQEEEALRAEISRLSLHDGVKRRAQAIGMIPPSPQAARVLPVTRKTPRRSGE